MAGVVGHKSKRTEVNVSFIGAEERARSMGLEMRHVKWLESPQLCDTHGHLYNGKVAIQRTPTVVTLQQACCTVGSLLLPQIPKILKIPVHPKPYIVA